MNYGMREFSLVVNYQDDFGVNAGLKLKAEKAGLDLGGSFGSHLVTTWKISGIRKTMSIHQSCVEYAAVVSSIKCAPLKMKCLL